MNNLDHTHSVNLEEEGQLSIDVYQTGDEIVILSTVSGVTMDDIEILVHGDMLIIRGKRLPPEPVKPEQYFYRECYWGPFSRTIILPRDIDVSNVKAKIRNGVLTIHLPKIASQSFKRVGVEAEE